MQSINSHTAEYFEFFVNRLRKLLATYRHGTCMWIVSIKIYFFSVPRKRCTMFNWEKRSFPYKWTNNSFIFQQSYGRNEWMCISARATAMNKASTATLTLTFYFLNLRTRSGQWAIENEVKQEEQYVKRDWDLWF